MNTNLSWVPTASQIFGCCKITRNTPYVSERTVNSVPQRDTKLKSTLGEKGPDDMHFKQNGAPPQGIGGNLNSMFLEKTVGRDGSVIWPPRSPDFIPLDFSFGETSPLGNTLPQCPH